MRRKDKVLSVFPLVKDIGAAANGVRAEVISKPFDLIAGYDVRRGHGKE